MQRAPAPSDLRRRRAEQARPPVHPRRASATRASHREIELAAGAIEGEEELRLFKKRDAARLLRGQGPGLVPGGRGSGGRPPVAQAPAVLLPWADAHSPLDVDPGRERAERLHRMPAGNRLSSLSGRSGSRSAEGGEAGPICVAPQLEGLEGVAESEPLDVPPARGAANLVRHRQRGAVRCDMA
eukprot:3236158-Pyramimonas_sp.AAC.1